MLDLPVLETPYPSMYPVYDVSEFVVAGGRPLAGGCWLQVQPNLIVCAIRFRTDDVTDNRNFLVIGLPAEVRPAQISPGIAMHYGTACAIQVNQFGNIYFPAFLDRKVKDELLVELQIIWPRRAA